MVKCWKMVSGQLRQYNVSKKVLTQSCYSESKRWRHPALQLFLYLVSCEAQAAVIDTFESGT